MMKRVRGFLMVLFFVCLSLNAQCPMCKTALKSNRDQKGASVGNGINKGILFLLATPYVLIGTAGLFWYTAKRRKKSNG